MVDKWYNTYGGEIQMKLILTSLMLLLCQNGSEGKGPPTFWQSGNESGPPPVLFNGEEVGTLPFVALIDVNGVQHTLWFENQDEIDLVEGLGGELLDSHVPVPKPTDVKKGETPPKVGDSPLEVF